MVELLEPGTEAETCLMAGRGMNGLRGVIVCFNPHNQRYTLELEKGDMMNLRMRNIRRFNFESDETKADDADHGEGKTGSSLPNFQPPPPPSEDQAKNEQDQPPVQGSTEASILGCISPINAILVAIAAYFYLQSRAGGNGSKRIDDYHHYHYNNNNASTTVGVTWPVIISCVIYAYIAWEWGTKPRQCDDRTEFRWSSLCLRLSFADVWEIMGLAGLLLWCLDVQMSHFISVGVMLFFGWKFGTRDGNRSFSWGNVKVSLSNLSIWEVFILAGIFEGGLHSMNAMARPRRR